MCATDLMVEDVLGPQNNDRKITLTLTDAQYELICKLKAGGVEVNAATIMSNALSDELSSRVRQLTMAEAVRDRIKINETHLADPVPGDQWCGNAFSRHNADDFTVMQRISENVIIVWMPHLRADGDEGFRRVNREWLSGRVHFNSGQERRLTNLDPDQWWMDCFPMTPDHNQYNDLIEYNKTCDYANVKDI